MVTEWGLLLPDFAAALVSDSVTMYATLLRSSVEALAVTLAWVVMRRITRGGAADYDYGVGKLENLTGLAVSGLLFASLLILLYEVVHRLHEPVRLAAGHCGVALGITLGATLLDSWFLVHNLRLARAEHSPLMEAQWRMYLVKVASGTIAIITLGASVACSAYPWSSYLDPLGSVLMSGFILFSIGSILHKSTWDLLDRTLDESMQILILQVLVEHFDAYHAFHGVRSRRSGSQIFVEVLMEFDGTRSMADVQKSINAIRGDIAKRIHDSVVLVAPVEKRDWPQTSTPPQSTAEPG